MSLSKLSKFNSKFFFNNKSHTTKKRKSSTKHKPLDTAFSPFYTITPPLLLYLLNYNDSSTKRLIQNGFDNMTLLKSVSYTRIDYSELNKVYKIYLECLARLKLDSPPHNIKYATEDMTRGLSKFISRRYQSHLPTTEITNAFVKLWECLTVFDEVIPHNTKNTKFNVFHICEAPGQMILACKYFTEQKRKHITSYNWYANSLNPFNKDVKVKYGNVFNDKYGLMKRNPDKWLWGADDTGDITNTDNIKWFRQKIQSDMPDINIIIGDGGLGAGNNPIILQRLDLAQVVMVLACSRKGGSCVIKHFTPYMVNHPETKNAIGFFISFIYLYYIAFEQVSLFKPYSSDMTSGEFYVIGTGFKGIDIQYLDKLYDVLDRFKLNNSLFDADVIPQTFIIQITTFINLMATENIKGYKKLNLLMQTKHTPVSRILLNDDKIEEILIPRYNTWINIYKFQ